MDPLIVVCLLFDIIISTTFPSFLTSLVMCKKAADFCMLVLYLAALLKLLIRYQRFLVESLRSFKNKII